MIPAVLAPGDHRFPPPEAALAEPDGLLAVGGRLDLPTLLAAYRAGIFPWFEDDRLPLWWSPARRAVLVPGRHHLSRSLRRRIRKGRWQITTDRRFAAVVAACAGPRRGVRGTWITPGMRRAYGELHRAGHAHSLECWLEGELVGGLYGVQVGGVFCGESMWSGVPDASKVAFVALSQTLAAAGFALIDCQLPSPHLERLGVETISRREFLAVLAKAGRWSLHWPSSEAFAEGLARLAQP